MVHDITERKRAEEAREQLLNELNALLGVDGTEESAIYMAAIGHPL
jgi:hypothetical protein